MENNYVKDAYKQERTVFYYGRHTAVCMFRSGWTVLMMVIFEGHRSKRTSWKACQEPRGSSECLQPSGTQESKTSGK
jgi:hypothetical protein